MKRLEGKIALVTGANRGIGRGIALCFAEEGADVAVNYRSHADEAQEVVKAVTDMGRRALALQADVADREQVHQMVKATVKHFGGLDIAVANAAMTVREPMVEASWEGVQRTIEVCQFGVFHTCQFAAQQMVAQGKGGKILIISSIHAELPFARSGSYNMAKAAINHMGATMANELARHHINVNVINPGWIDTPGEHDLATDEQLQKGARRIPWKRLGTPEDIARPAVFLVSDDADYVTGSVLRVDGGFLLGLTLPEPSPVA